MLQQAPQQGLGGERLTHVVQAGRAHVHRVGSHQLLAPWAQLTVEQAQVQHALRLDPGCCQGVQIRLHRVGAHDQQAQLKGIAPGWAKAVHHHPAVQDVEQDPRGHQLIQPGDAPVQAEHVDPVAGGHVGQAHDVLDRRREVGAEVGLDLGDVDDPPRLPGGPGHPAGRSTRQPTHLHELREVVGNHQADVQLPGHGRVAGERNHPP